MDLDHISFAVGDIWAWARRLRRELGATPIAGEVLPEFRYVLFHIGGPHNGSRLELMEPTGPGFLTRFLNRHGEGPHHLTFTVPDLAAAVTQVRRLGLQIVGEDYGHTPWREAFVRPSPVTGIVLQLAQTDRVFPAPAELLDAAEPPVGSFPSNRSGTDPNWWEPLWHEPAGTRASLGPVHLGTPDLEAIRDLLGGVTGGEIFEFPEGLELRWRRSSVVVGKACCAGVQFVDLDGGPLDGVRIGGVRIGGHDE